MGSKSRIVTLCVALAALAMDGTSFANATSPRGEAQTEVPIESKPRLAVIALAQQHISVYSATKKIMKAPVSTGASGYETPAGIYSILEKEEDHHSNLYDDASMPFMERLTWTGIAMHAGALPGYPASHGCARMPHGFARQLYQATKLGMRVVVVREDIIPADIEQPNMFNRAWEALSPETSPPGSANETEILARLQAIKETKLSEAEAAKQYELKARALAEKRLAEAASAARLVEAAQANLDRLEAKSVGGKSRPEAVSNRLEKREAAAGVLVSKIEAARLKLETAKAQAQGKMDVAKQAQEEAKAATGVASERAQAAEIARQNAWPVSIFISRKTRTIQIRRGREPIFEGPVTIRDPDTPIGTFVFTALSTTEIPGRMRWNVLSLYKNATNIEPYLKAKQKLSKRSQPQPADVVSARSALERITIPPQALDLIARLPLPGASLIISDEGLSSETGKDTDFIVFMSGEPQGGATSRVALVSDKGQKKRTKSFARSRFDTDGEARRGGEFSLFGGLFD